MKTRILSRAGVMALVTLLFSTFSFANNISLTNAHLTGRNTALDYVLVQFDLSWENSWRNDIAGSGQGTPYNWDAAWIFVKYRIAGGEWQHAWLNNTGHSAPSGSAVDIGLLDPESAFNATTNPGLGAFIYRSANGTGTFSKTGVKLRWNYGANGVPDNGGMEIKIFAIEMVYVPQGPFYLGSGGTETSHFYKYPTTTDPYFVNSEAEITVGTTAGNLYYGSSAYGGDRSGPIPLAFPKGYNAFYCMKYEISQQGYADFLNTLTRIQQDTRADASIPLGTTNVTNRYVMSNSVTVQFRSSIRCDAVIDANDPVNFYCDLNGNGIGGETDDGQWIACNYINWSDITAYMDWSGLRPLSELEYEKSCRGFNQPLINEYAWGTSTLTSDFYSISNNGQNDEYISANYSLSSGNSIDNTTDQNIDGPVKVGIFSSTAGNYGRISSGSTFYGMMEMSGNLYERTASAGDVVGRSYSSINGNGILNTFGDADPSSWPGNDATGSSARGGSLYQTASGLRVSSREFASYTLPDIQDRTYRTGGRGIRSFAWNCGQPVVSKHLAGSVAPVTKTVSYSTVQDIPGETSKCWITQNLGADQQATAVSDGTEASAGWYWQFNRMQGFKHDGTTRTPATTWISVISENADWLPENDPCNIEMGNGWRLPTYSEWFNVDDIGGWAYDSDPWNSALKIHDAGLLNSSDGSILNRGSVGNYWSSNQNLDTYGWYLAFLSFACEMNYNEKAFAMPVRCIKD